MKKYVKKLSPILCLALVLSMFVTAHTMVNAQGKTRHIVVLKASGDSKNELQPDPYELPFLPIEQETTDPYELPFIPIEQPTTEQSTTEQPTTEQPTTEQPTTEQPTTEQPTTEQPTTEQPTTEQPTTEQLTTEQPTTEQPTTEQPTTEQPTTEQSTTEQPTTEQLTTEQPTTEPAKPANAVWFENTSEDWKDSDSVEICIDDGTGTVSDPVPMTRYGDTDYWYFDLDGSGINIDSEKQYCCFIVELTGEAAARFTTSDLPLLSEATGMDHAAVTTGNIVKSSREPGTDVYEIKWTGVDIPEKPERLTGDVNGDGIVTIDDATAIQKYLAKLITLDDAALKAADANGDGIVTIDDATAIQKYLAHFIDNLG